LKINEADITQELIAQLQSLLAPDASAQCLVNIQIETEAASVDLVANHDWRIKPSAKILNELSRLFGSDNCQLHY